MPPCRRASPPPAAVILVISALLVGCSENVGPDVTPTATFSRLQSDVFDLYCVGCHSSGSVFATQSGLVLEAGEAYEQLVGAESRNVDAKSDGNLRVDPGNPDRSLLLRKLRWDVPAVYGQAMPLGGPPLPAGRVEFVRQWILAGAPRDGEVADPELLLDETPQQIAAFEPLLPPEDGYQLHLEPFTIQPRSEREIYVYKRLGNEEEVWIDRVEIAMRPNTHHFILYRLPESTPESAIPSHDVIRDLWRPDGTRNSNPSMFYRRYLAGRDYRFPEGVALRLPADASLDLNSHYVNRTDSAIFGEVYANLHTVPASTVTHEAYPLFLNNANIDLPAGQRTTVSRTFRMSEPARVFLLTSHMHARGERFVIRIVGGPRHGEVVYETTSWDLPDQITFDEPIELREGDGLRSEVTYFNPTNERVTFGLTSEDEMSLIIGYYTCPDVCSSAFVASMVDEVVMTSSMHAH